MNIIKKIAREILANDGAQHSHHCTMVYLEDCSSEKDFNFFRLTQQIPEEDIYREKSMVDGPFGTKLQNPEDTYGLEHDPHITLLFGLTNENDYFKARKLFSTISQPKFKIGEISSFRREDKPFDVIKLSIISDDFAKINQELLKFPNENKFDKYIAHMTLGYVKKGCCKDLEGECDWTGTDYVAPKAQWSHVDHYKLDLPFSKK